MMEKKIEISVDENGYHFTSDGLQEHEVIGLLEIYRNRLMFLVVDGRKKEKIAYEDTKT